MTESLVPLGSGQMFDRIAARYDTVNRVLSLGLDQRWRRRVVRALGLAKGELGEHPRVLDVATGTGDLAIEIARACTGASVVGLDPSPGMLAIAEKKVGKRGLGGRITLVEGDAQALPQGNCEMDAATIAFGIRNVPDRPKALRELARVVRPGGKIAVLELGEPRKGPLAAMARFHAHYFVPKIGALLSGKREYAYLQKSVAAFPPADEFARIMRDAGLRVLEVLPMTFGVCTMYLATPAEES
ncbi:MAG: bifunctional demethylmenaquinone methyltransferase/2-methoxy-6-polyprenyl-1,4-benzoquinol methylase UbiE [Deltaproteobacteria bacterium]|nr:bifunctional demethylmenaquinone methyltransferase/2-methoxy-6-polyprenyl-1,4-benzoquinol methylase UbiE [Deltaproteobacteria bacterium]